MQWQEEVGEGERPLSLCCHCAPRPPPRALTAEEQEQARKTVEERSMAWKRARRGMRAFLETLESGEGAESDLGEEESCMVLV